MSPQPFLAWPGWPHLRMAVGLGVLQSAWWVLVYGGADWLTEQRSERVRLHFDAELGLPFVPEFLAVYMSLNLLFPLTPFILRRGAELRALIVALFVVTGIAGLGFLLLPADPAYAPTALDGFWADAFAFNRRIILRHNLAPSLHVAFSTILLAAFGTGRSKLARSLLAAWGALIVASTLLIHEHHIVDVVTGFLLGWAGYRLLYRRLLRWDAATGRPSPATDRARPV
jgi:membrane-associated phospholipid phosphatase